MNSKQSLLVQQQGSDELYDLEDTYSCVCLEIPEPVATEVQDFASQTWYGEDGVDVYVPNRINVKAFDWEIKCGIKASSRSSLTMYLDELQYLLQAGGKLSVYSSFLERGFSEVVYKGLKDVENFVDATGMSVVTFKLVLWVIDPTNTTAPDDATNPTSLI